MSKTKKIIIAASFLILLFIIVQAAQIVVGSRRIAQCVDGGVQDDDLFHAVGEAAVRACGFAFCIGFLSVFRMSAV